MKGVCRAFIIVMVVLSWSHSVRATDYDEQEKVRRLAQKLVDEDEQQREAAKERYEQAHPVSLPPTQLSPSMTVIILGIAFAICYKCGLFIVGQYREWVPQKRESGTVLSEEAFKRLTSPLKPQVQTSNWARDERAHNSGGDFLALIDHALANGVEIAYLQHAFWKRWAIEFSVEAGKLNVTQETLNRIGPLIPEIKLILDHKLKQLRKGTVA